MLKSRILCVLLTVLFLLAPVSACAWFGSLDTEGKWKPPVYSCEDDKLVSHTFTTTKHSYKFKRKCNVSDNTQAYVTHFITEIEWTPDGKLVQKTWLEVYPNFSVKVEGYSKTDPWAYGTECTVTDFHYTIPSSGFYMEERDVYHNLLEEYTKAPYIRTISSIAPQRYGLQQELSQMPMQPPSEIPTIYTPEDNKTYFLGTVPVKIKYTPAWGLSWTVQYRANSSQAWQNVMLTTLVKNPSTSGNILTGNFNYDKAGQWRFQVACGYPGSPSSAWRTITILPVPQKGPFDIKK